MATLSRTQQQTAQLGQLLKTAGGRQKLAASLGPSLRRRRDYMSIARKALMVETLPDGALPIYDKEFDATGKSFVEAFVVGEEGGDIVRVTKPIRVTVPTFEIVANPMIPITQIKERRFDLVARSLNLAKAEVGATEDGYVFGLFDAVATAATAATLVAGTGSTDYVFNEDLNIFVATSGITTPPSAWVSGGPFAVGAYTTGSDGNLYVCIKAATTQNPVVGGGGYAAGYWLFVGTDTFAVKGIDVDSMADAFGQVQRHDLSVAYVFFNPRDYVDLLKWTDANIDRETQRKLLKTGVMGYLWGATLLQSRKINYGEVYVLADAEFLGVIPERIPLTVMSADRPDLRQIGFSIFENLGFLVFNPSGVQRINVVRGTGNV